MKGTPAHTFSPTLKKEPRMWTFVQGRSNEFLSPITRDVVIPSSESCFSSFAFLSRTGCNSGAMARYAAARSAGLFFRALCRGKVQRFPKPRRNADRNTWIGHGGDGNPEAADSTLGKRHVVLQANGQHRAAGESEGLVRNKYPAARGDDLSSEVSMPQPLGRGLSLARLSKSYSADCDSSAAASLKTIFWRLAGLSRGSGLHFEVTQEKIAVPRRGPVRRPGRLGSLITSRRTPVIPVRSVLAEIS